MGALALTSCNDYLDVDAPSQITTDLAFSATSEANKALNGVYAKIMIDGLYGNTLYNGLTLNSDVDYATNSNSTAQTNAPRRFDCTAESSSAESLWNNLYKAIETANEFIYNLEHSSIYNESNTDYESLTQMMGEAKVMRAMCYYELLCYYGDVPFMMEPTYVTNDFYPAIQSRDEIYKSLIADLEEIAPKMKMSSNLDDGIERVSKEACWALIARMSLQAGGYSLRPTEGNDKSYGYMARPENYKSFYETARAYADSVIESGSHALTKAYDKVFIDECNFIVNSGDDAIFEIPFAQNSTGQWGYQQGPTVSASEGETPHAWGASNGGVRNEAFYRFTFDENDLRRDVANGLQYYASTGVPTMRAAYNVHNNKWSKLWHETGLGSQTSGSTGINFAYLRYADVLLMFAEAENELNGPTDAAKEALKTVRRRAFSSSNHAKKVNEYTDSVAADKETFLNAVLNERKWEFAGENSRWKDLVRNNKYAETMFYTFLRYYSVAENSAASSSTMDMVEEHDGIKWSEILPYSIFSCIIKNPGDGHLNFANKTLPMRFMLNPYKAGSMPQITPANYFKNAAMFIKHKAGAINSDSLAALYNGTSVSNVTSDQVAYCDSLYKNFINQTSSYYKWTLADTTITVMSEKDIYTQGSSTISWTETQFYNWWQDAGYPKNEVMYSLYGFIRADESGNFSVVRDGQEERIEPIGYDVKNLPVVRYLLPIPQEAITRSSGAYTNHYGY